MGNTLRLASPYMRGAAVSAAQAQLIKAGYLARGAQDGVFGPVTANATKRAKWALGYPNADVTPVYGSMLNAYLAGKRSTSATMKLRARRRRAAALEESARFGVGVAAADQMVRWYQSGWKELPAGSNYVPALSQFCRGLKLSAYYSNMGYPWCALAVFSAALAHGSKAAALGLRDGKYNALYTPEIQAVANRGAFGLSAVAKSSIRKGVAVLFDFDGGGVDHIGIALGKPGATVTAGGKRWAAAKGQVVTVEGNTSYDSGGSQANGGCVAIRVRDLSEIRTAFVIS